MRRIIRNFCIIVIAFIAVFSVKGWSVQTNAFLIMTPNEIFEADNGLIFVLYNNDSEYVVYNSDESISGTLIIPSTYNGKPVTGICSKAFAYCNMLDSIIIPESISQIGNEIFVGCTMLGEIIVDDNNPIYHSSGNCLIETASKTLLHGCSTSIIPDDGSVTSIADRAFQDCNSLINITIPDSVTSIGEAAFLQCSNLKSTTVGNGVINIDSYAFYYCTCLENITIGENVKSIGYSAFAYCANLTGINIPNSVTSIDRSAFEGCGIIGIFIPDSVTSIGESAFVCSSLESIIVDENNPIYHSKDNCLIETNTKILIRGCKTSIIPDDGSVTGIFQSAFRYCEGLESIVIPNGVTIIGVYAFSGIMSLVNVTIPYSVISIGNDVFGGCDNITIHCYEYSKAHRYAVSKGVFYEFLTTVCGDVDGDGIVTNKDSAIVARVCARWTGYGINKYNFNAADADTDGKVTNKDSAIIARHLAHWTGYEKLPYRMLGLYKKDSSYFLYAPEHSSIVISGGKLYNSYLFMDSETFENSIVIEDKNNPLDINDQSSWNEAYAGGFYFLDDDGKYTQLTSTYLANNPDVKSVEYGVVTDVMYSSYIEYFSNGKNNIIEINHDTLIWGLFSKYSNVYKQLSFYDFTAMFDMVERCNEYNSTDLQIQTLVFFKENLNGDIDVTSLLVELFENDNNGEVKSINDLIFRRFNQLIKH